MVTVISIMIDRSVAACSCLVHGESLSSRRCVGVDERIMCWPITDDFVTSSLDHRHGNDFVDSGASARLVGVVVVGFAGAGAGVAHFVDSLSGG